MLRPPNPAPHDRVTLFVDGEPHRAVVVRCGRAADGDALLGELTIVADANSAPVALAGAHVELLAAAEDGAAWCHEVEILDAEPHRLLARFGDARRIQRRADVRQPVGWHAALGLAPPALVTPRSPVRPDPSTRPVRALRVVTDDGAVTDAPLAGAEPADGQPAADPDSPDGGWSATTWFDATCIDLSAGGALLAVAGRRTFVRETEVAVRIEVPDLGVPHLRARIVSSRPDRGHTLARVVFELPSSRVRDDLSTLVLREQFAARRRRFN